MESGARSPWYLKHVSPGVDVVKALLGLWASGPRMSTRERKAGANTLLVEMGL